MHNTTTPALTDEYFIHTFIIFIIFHTYYMIYREFFLTLRIFCEV